MTGSTRDVKLVFTADNRSAVKAMKQISDQSDKTTRTMKTDADEQTMAMRKVKDSAEGLKASMMGLAGTVGIAGVAFGIKDLVVGGITLQAQQAQLQAALRATGQAAGGTQSRLQAFAESLSTRGGFSMTENLGALTAFVRETHSATEAQSALSLATNIARGRNMDLASAQTVVQRAYTGSVGKLQQLLGPMVAAREAAVGLTVAHSREIAALQNQAQLMGPLGQMWLRQQEINDHITAQQAALATMTDKHATAQMVLAAATQEFSGATSAYSKTTQGRLTILTNTFHNLVDELGVALLPTVNKVVGAFASVAHFLSQNRALVESLIGPVLALVGAWSGMRVLQKVSGMVTDLAKAFGLLKAEEATSGGLGGLLGNAEKGAAEGGFMSFLGKAAGIAGAALPFLFFEHGGAVAKHFAGGGPAGGYTLGDTVPAWLDPREGVLSPLGMQTVGGRAGLDALNSGIGPGMGGRITITPAQNIVKLDSRTVGTMVTRWALNEAARGPTSLVGGSLVTGAPGLPA